MVCADAYIYLVCIWEDGMDKRVNCMVREGEGGECLLSMHEGLDVEAEGWADAHDILAIELLEDSRLSCII